MAANKAVDPQKIPAAVSSKAKAAKGKPKIPAAKNKDPAGAETPVEKAPEPVKAETPVPVEKPPEPVKPKRAPYPDTAYNIARKNFMATSLDSIKLQITVSPCISV